MEMKLWTRSMLFMLGTSLLTSAQQSPEKLSVSNFKEVRDYVIGDTADPEYYKVAWKENVLDGVVSAKAQDKPILLWLYFGGPLGNC